MKHQKYVSIAIVFLCMVNTANAQLGGLLKKTMQKVTAIESAEIYTNQEVLKNGALEEQSAPQEQDGYNVSSSGISLYSNELKITFSTVPSNSGDGEPSKRFTTSNHIYAKLTATKGSLKDVLKITDNDDGIKIYLVLYDNDGVKIKKFVSIAETFEISAEHASKTSATVDILPDPIIYEQGKQSDFWAGAAFTYGHNQYSFPQNGNYKVGLFVKNEKVDDWGKAIYKEDIVFADFFDYNFLAKDAAAIVKAGSKINDLKNTAAKNVVTALPKEWLEKSSVTVMGFTQAQLISMYESSFATKMDAHTVVKFHPTSSNGGWTTQNNDYGIPIYRYSNQWYTIFIKYADGKTCFYQGFGLRQQYNGAGTYGKAFIDKNEYHMADCNSMK